MDQRKLFEERLKVLREKGEADGYAGFEDEALSEAERRRDEAIAEAQRTRHLGELDPLEEEMFQDSLNEQGLFRGTGCFSRMPDLSHDEDLTLHKRLVRDDFLEKRPDQTHLPGDQSERVDAYVFVSISCAVGAKVEREGDDTFVARAKNAQYFPLVSRTRSWWNPNSRRDEDAILDHEQLHVELARLLSEELTDKFRTGRVIVRGDGRTEEAAVARFQMRWGTHIQQMRDELRRLERAYDKDTRYGRDAARQAAWKTRFDSGLDAVRAASGG